MNPQHNISWSARVAQLKPAPSPTASNSAAKKANKKKAEWVSRAQEPPSLFAFLEAAKNKQQPQHQKGRGKKTPSTSKPVQQTRVRSKPPAPSYQRPSSGRVVRNPNALDAAAPEIVRRGKTRDPKLEKKKKLSTLKRTILRERRQLYMLAHPEFSRHVLQMHPSMFGYKLVPARKASIRMLEATRVVDGTVEATRVVDGTVEALSVGDETAQATRVADGTVGASSLSDGNVEVSNLGDPTVETSTRSNPQVVNRIENNKQNLQLTHADDRTPPQGNPSTHNNTPDCPAGDQRVAACVPLDMDVRHVSPVFMGCYTYETSPRVEKQRPPAPANPNKQKQRAVEAKKFKMPNKLFVRGYVTQCLSKALDQEVSEMVGQLMKFQERTRQKEPMKAKKKRRMVFGIREVLRGIRAHNCKCVIVAPNIEQGCLEGGIDDKVEEILKLCREEGDTYDAVPVVFALNRRKLGRALGKMNAVSVIGVYSADGSHELFKQVLKDAKVLRAKWEELVNREFHGANWQRCARCDDVIGYVRHDCLVCGVTRCYRCHQSCAKKPCPGGGAENDGLCDTVRVARSLPRDVLHKPDAEGQAEEAGEPKRARAAKETDPGNSAAAEVAKDDAEVAVKPKLSVNAKEFVPLGH